MSKKNSIAFKGTSNGLFLNIDEGVPFEDIPKFMKEIAVKSKHFYKGGTVIGLTGKKLSYKEKAVIESLLLESFDLKVMSLEMPEPVQSHKKSITEKEEKLEVQDIKPIESAKEIVEPTKIMEVKSVERAEATPPQRAHYVFGTLRSGKSVEYSGDVVVIGDVNPGAVIVAEGNIFVMGRVMGFVHAGSAGDDQAFIVANLLKPTQIRISKHISVPPSDDLENNSHGIEKAYVSEGVIKIEAVH